MEKVNLTIRLDREMKESIEAFCKKRDVTISQVVRAAFRRYLNEAQEAEKQERAMERSKDTRAQVAAASAFVRGPGAGKSSKNRR